MKPYLINVFQCFSSRSKIKALNLITDEKKENNLSYSELGECFGVCAQTVCNWFEKKGIKARKRTHSQKFVDSMSQKRIVLDERTLRKLYIDDKLSIEKIAEKLNSRYDLVRSNLQRFKIPIRSIEIYTTSKLTSELLKRLYVDEDLTSRQIADRLGYSALTIQKRLHIFGIKKRVLKRFPKDQLIELYSNEKLSIKNILKQLGTSHTFLYINLRYYGIPLRGSDQRRSGLEREKTLRRLYIDEKKTPLEIAEFLDLSESYVKRKLKDFKIS
jgi:hypothetical protein